MYRRAAVGSEPRGELSGPYSRTARGDRAPPRSSSGLAVRVLLAIVCLQAMYIASRVFSETLLCDDLRESLETAEKDGERARLVLKTLTLSCNEAELQRCHEEAKSARERTSMALELKERHLFELETCKDKLGAAKKRVQEVKAAVTAATQEAKEAKAEQERLMRGKGLKSTVGGPNAKRRVGNSGTRAGSSHDKESSESLEDQEDNNNESGEDDMSDADEDDDEEEEEEYRHAPWLTIGVPTIPRKNGAEYLSDMLEALVQELPSVHHDPLFHRIKVVVMNNAPGEHESFAKNRAKYSTGPWSSYFDFVDNVERETSTPAIAHEIARGERRKHREEGFKMRKPPGPRVQQQSRDVVSLLGYTAKTYRTTYYLFMEDDFTMCSNTIEALRYLINRATHFREDWLAIRASYGLNGVLIHGDDISALASYLQRNQARRPPDHLTTEWFAGETIEAAGYKHDRPHIGFRFNVLKHIGTISTLRKSTHKQSYPECWQPLQEDAVFAIESFKPEVCPDDDIWPCNWSDQPCNPAHQLCFPNGTKVNTKHPARIPWEVDLSGSQASRPRIVPKIPTQEKEPQSAAPVTNSSIEEQAAQQSTGKQSVGKQKKRP